MSHSSTHMDRRDFLCRFRTRASSAHQTVENTVENVVRPPWSKPLLAHCTGCAKCISACPEHILAPDSQQKPILDFTKGECTFCKACVNNCPEDVFADPTLNPPWHLDVTIAPSCFCEAGIFCRSCGDACPQDAIRFVPQMGGRARVVIDHDSCNGCGACLGTCPARAITISPAKENRHG